MDGGPPPGYHLSARPTDESIVTFKNGRLILEGEGWTGPMKCLVPGGWMSARKYKNRFCSVQVAYKNSINDVEKLRQVLTSDKVERESVKIFVAEPIESIKLAKVVSISKHKVLSIDIESENKYIKCLVAEYSDTDSSGLVKIIVSDSTENKSAFCEYILRTIKFDL